MEDKDPKVTEEKQKPKKSFIARFWYYPVAAVCIAVFIFAAVKLIGRYKETRASKDMTEKTQYAVTVVDSTETPPAKPADEPQDTAEPEPEIERPPISVDFEYLHSINPDIMGWLYCEDTVLNYEVMYAEDNFYYLGHLPDNSYNQYGSIFIDYRCAGDFSDPNTVIYGHDMQDGTMFGGLNLYRDQQYYEDHSVIYLLTPEHNYKLEIVSGFVHTAELSMYELPSNDYDVEQFLPVVIAENEFKPIYEIQEGDRFVTLSTCAYDFNGARFALFCRMVEIG